MKELILAIQFILSQETYFTEEGKITSEIDGRMSYTKEMLYLDIDGQVEEYYVDTITPSGGGYLILFSEDGVYGAVSAQPTSVYFDILYEEDGELDHIQVRYKVKITNLK